MTGKKVFSRVGAEVAAGKELARGLLVLCISQQQGHRFEVQVNERQMESLRGPVDQVRWHELEFALRLVRDAVVRAGLASSESLAAEAVIERSERGWDPLMELRLMGDATYDLPRIQATALAVLQLVIHGVSQNDDAVSALAGPDHVHVVGVATEGLNKMGGRGISHPIDVRVDEVPVARLTGRFASRPDKSSFNPVPEVLYGRLRGFDMDEEALIFQPDAGGRVLVHYGKQNVDLMVVAELCSAKGRCRLRVHRTIDRRGQARYAFVGIVTCADDGAMSALEHSLEMASKISSTNS